MKLHVIFLDGDNDSAGNPANFGSIFSAFIIEPIAIFRSLVNILFTSEFETLVVAVGGNNDYVSFHESSFN